VLLLLFYVLDVGLYL